MGICVKPINTIVNDITYLEIRIELQSRNVLDNELHKYLQRKKNILSILNNSHYLPINRCRSNEPAR